MDYADWEPPPHPESPPRYRPAMLALGCAACSFGLLFIAYFGWFADVVVGPVAFGVSVVAVIHALRRKADRALAFGSLALSTPALAWAVYALAGGPL